jgi:5-methylcytosine-specific restriction endonuclease McrA
MKALGPTAKRRATKAREKARLLAIAVAEVRARDRGRCRVCGGLGVDPHHIIFRSLGGKDTTDNLCIVCFVCHEAIHAHRITVSGNANQRLKIVRAA